MNEKILALLVAKFAGVRKDGLAQLAKSLGLQVTTEEEAQALIDKLTVEKVTDFVKDFRADVDKEVGTANKTHERALKDKYNFVEKKAGEPKESTDPDPNKDLAKTISDAVTAAVKPLQDKIASIEGGKVSETRRATLDSKLKDVPENYKAKILKDFDRMSFEKDEDFDKYLTETETDVAALNQELADKGLSEHGKPNVFGSKDKDGVSKATQAFIDSQAKDKNPLAGKELSTQK